MMTKIFFLFFFSFQVGAQTLESIQLNKKAAVPMKEQNFTAGQALYIQALGKDPFWSVLHLNLGVSFYGQGQLEKAQASYETALKLAENDELRFISLYNLGELFGKAKKTDEALKYYQRALEFNPESIETKTNIELLIQDQKGGGQGQDQNKEDSKDNKDSKSPQDSKDKKDQDDKKDQKDKEGDQKKDQDKPKEYEKNKPQPKKFKSEDLSQGDVNKILGEIKQQEQKIQQDYNRKEVKERPRDKDW